jgi:hypothetical protein
VVPAKSPFAADPLLFLIVIGAPEAQRIRSAYSAASLALPSRFVERLRKRIE